MADKTQKTNKRKASKHKREPLKIRAASRLRRILGSWSFLITQVAFIAIWVVTGEQQMAKDRSKPVPEAQFGSHYPGLAGGNARPHQRA
jgi:uncharacterized membrane protein